MTSGQFRWDPPSSGGGDVRRAAAAVAVQGVYRLVKACLLHSDSNQVIAQLVPPAVSAVGDFCAVAGAEGMSLVFAEEGIFVNGQVLRTSREGYDTARELGALLGACGVNELTLEKGVRAPELSSFARLLAEAQRDRAAAERLARAELRGVRVRSVPSPLTGGAGRVAQSAPAPELPLLTRSIRVYAASLLVMRAAHAELRASGGAPLDEVRRAAQKLVSLAEEDTRPLLTLALSIEGDPDDAALSVATAVVALAIARQLTTERRSLSALATAALLYDAGRRRLLRPATPPIERASVAPHPIDRALGEEEQARLPASAAAALAALGMLHAPSMARTVILYEALALRPDPRPRSRAPLQRDRRPPTLLARVLAVARAFTELRAVPPLGAGAEARAPLDEIVQRLLDLTDGAGAPGGWGSTERALVKLLVGALGVEAPPSSRTPAPRAAPVPASRRPSSPPVPASRSSSPRLPASRPASPQVPAAHTSSSPAPPSRRATAQTQPQPATLPPPRPGERVRTAPAALAGLLPQSSQPVAAAWLGRPLTPPGAAASEPPRSAKRPPPIDRAALLEKLRAENLASTQPPPPDVFEQPVVPPPPRLPTESGPMPARPAVGALFSAQAVEPRSKPAPGAPRSAGPISASPLTLKTSGPRAGLAESPPSSRGRRFDPRAELDEETWSDELHTMAPPSAPATLEPPPAPSTIDPPAAHSTAMPPPPPPTLRGSHPSDVPPPPPTWPGASHQEADTGEGWPDLDDLPLVEASPASAEPLAAPPSRRPDPRQEPEDEAAAAAMRDRLLAEYLAELDAAPSSRSGLPSRPLIPREEPPEPPTSRGGRARQGG